MFEVYFWATFLVVIFVGIHYFFIKDMIAEHKEKKNDDSKSSKGQPRG